MHTRQWVLAFFVLLASCRSRDNAGIVLNVDTDVTADRTIINRLVVTVDGSPQEWNLTRPLPGSLGIKTSAGKKYLTVDGLAGTVVRGRWNGIVEATLGSVVVQDVHLTSVSLIDAGTADSRLLDALAKDSHPSERGTEGTADLGANRDGADARGPVDSAGADGTGPLLKLDAGADGARPGDAFRQDNAAPDGPALTPDGAVLADVGQPTGDSADPQPAVLSGTLAVHSQFDISASAAAPGPVRDALNLVHLFVEDPGASILDYADQAGVPAVSTLRAALPNSLTSRLTGWMSGYIKSAGSNGVVPYDGLVWLDETVRALLLYWSLDSRLVLPTSGPGTHAPRALGFTDSSGSPLAFAIDPTLLTPATNVTATVAWVGGADGASIATISDHAFALPFGRYAVPALDAILLGKNGSPNLAAYLSDTVGCAGMAAYVASQCVSVVCVGHESDLTDLCEGGLAEAARQIDAQIQSIDFKAIRFQRGIATVVENPATNPPSTELHDGAWTVTVDFGNGPEPANATFTAGPEATTRF